VDRREVRAGSARARLFRRRFAGEQPQDDGVDLHGLGSVPHRGRQHLVDLPGVVDRLGELVQRVQLLGALGDRFFQVPVERAQLQGEGTGFPEA
jgi:hypothetical protein